MVRMSREKRRRQEKLVKKLMKYRDAKMLSLYRLPKPIRRSLKIKAIGSRIQRRRSRRQARAQ